MPPPKHTGKPNRPGPENLVRTGGSRSHVTPPKPRPASRLLPQPYQIPKAGPRTYRLSQRELQLLRALLLQSIVGMGSMRCTTDGGVVVMDIRVNIVAAAAAVVVTEAVKVVIVAVGADTVGIGVAEKVGTAAIGVEEKVGTADAVEADIGAIVAVLTTLDGRYVHGPELRRTGTE